MLRNHLVYNARMWKASEKYLVFTVAVYLMGFEFAISWKFSANARYLKSLYMAWVWDSVGAVAMIHFYTLKWQLLYLCSFVFMTGYENYLSTEGPPCSQPDSQCVSGGFFFYLTHKDITRIKVSKT